MERIYLCAYKLYPPTYMLSKKISGSIPEKYIRSDSSFIFYSHDLIQYQKIYIIFLVFLLNLKQA